MYHVMSLECTVTNTCGLGNTMPPPPPRDMTADNSESKT
jgi:hypothetical protein